jgi:hypothetical protein
MQPDDSSPQACHHKGAPFPPPDIIFIAQTIIFTMAFSVFSMLAKNAGGN